LTTAWTCFGVSAVLRPGPRARTVPLPAGASAIDVPLVLRLLLVQGISAGLDRRDVCHASRRLLLARIAASTAPPQPCAWSRLEASRWPRARSVPRCSASGSQRPWSLGAVAPDSNGETPIATPGQTRRGVFGLFKRANGRRRELSIAAESEPSCCCRRRRAFQGAPPGGRTHGRAGEGESPSSYSCRAAPLRRDRDQRPAFCAAEHAWASSNARGNRCRSTPVGPRASIRGDRAWLRSRPRGSRGPPSGLHGARGWRSWCRRCCWRARQRPQSALRSR
jgi:hypothetical protein